jgi:hypothetical protein
MDTPEKQREVSKGLERAATVVVYTLLVATLFSIVMGVYALADLVF